MAAYIHTNARVPRSLLTELNLAMIQFLLFTPQVCLAMAHTHTYIHTYIRAYTCTCPTLLTYLALNFGSPQAIKSALQLHIHIHTYTHTYVHIHVRVLCNLLAELDFALVQFLLFTPQICLAMAHTHTYVHTHIHTYI
jgi:hypothetical protein